MGVYRGTLVLGKMACIFSSIINCSWQLFFAGLQSVNVTTYLWLNCHPLLHSVWHNLLFIVYVKKLQLFQRSFNLTKMILSLSRGYSLGEPQLHVTYRTTSISNTNEVLFNNSFFNFCLTVIIVL